MSDYLTKSDYEKYYGLLDKKGLECKSVFSLLSVMKKKNDVLVLSDSKIVRGCCKLAGISKDKIGTNRIKVENHYALVDALNILRKKSVTVFFYNRIGLKKDGYEYSKLAIARMKNKVSFPKIAEKPNLYNNDLKEILGDYSEEEISDISKIPQIIKKGNIYCHEDIASKAINVIGGRRVTVFGTNSEQHTIHVYGRCGAFGYAVKDDETFPSQLQRLLTDNRMNYKVVNKGLWGGEDNLIFHNFFFDVTEIKEGDIVLFYMKHLETKLLPEYSNYGMYYKNITDEWHQYPEAINCFYDKPGHMNAAGYRNVAEIIFNDMKEKGFSVTTESDFEINAEHLSKYLKKYSDADFEKEVNEYAEKLLNEYSEIDTCQGRIGAIVMNCNPFTLGHRYLIEYAAKIVDRLVIFVVEEDKSFFKFEDRFAMVNNGVEDLENVTVVPSGKFIISTLTFPEYFLKDYVKEKEFDISQDLVTFCDVIARKMRITVRFAGEEPFDPVTKSYNENMSRILPTYGIDFVEIPRKKVDNSDEVINATRVRKLLNDGDVLSLKKYVPESTYKILIQKYRN